MVGPRSDDPRVLVVARRAANRQLLTEVIETLECTVRGAEQLRDVDAALGEGSFALALVDLDGFSRQVWGTLRSLADRGVPIVVMTRSRTEEIQDTTLKIGVRTVLEKPVGKGNLRALVRSLVTPSGRRSSAEA